MRTDEAESVIERMNEAAKPYSLKRLGRSADDPYDATYTISGPGTDGMIVVDGLNRSIERLSQLFSAYAAGYKAATSEIVPMYAMGSD